MVEKNIHTNDLVALLGRDERSIRGKITEQTAFTLAEAIKVKEQFFPDIDIEVLFASDKTIT